MKSKSTYSRRSETANFFISNYLLKAEKCAHCVSYLKDIPYLNIKPWSWCSALSKRSMSDVNFIWEFKIQWANPIAHYRQFSPQCETSPRGRGMLKGEGEKETRQRGMCSLWYGLTRPSFRSLESLADQKHRLSLRVADAINFSSGVLTRTGSSCDSSGMQNSRLVNSIVSVNFFLM